jgi:hypothetical protein
MKVAMNGDLACLTRSVAREAILVFYLALVTEKELQGPIQTQRKLQQLQQAKFGLDSKAGFQDQRNPESSVQ